MLTPNWPDPNQTNSGGNNFEISADQNNDDSNALGATWPTTQIDKQVWPTDKDVTQIVTDCQTTPLATTEDEPTLQQKPSYQTAEGTGSEAKNIYSPLENHSQSPIDTIRCMLSPYYTNNSRSAQCTTTPLLEPSTMIHCLNDYFKMGFLTSRAGLSFDYADAGALPSQLNRRRTISEEMQPDLASD